LTLPLDVDPRRFGAAKVDRIGLQVLYCPDGWTWCLPQAHPLGSQRLGEVRLSNRVDFAAGGN
jgi:hypothetical protein